MSAAATPQATVDALAVFAAAQRADLRTLDEIRESRPRIDVLSARRARPYGPWLRVTAAIERLNDRLAGGSL